MGSSSSNALESRIKGAIFSFGGSMQITQQQATTNGKDEVAFAEGTHLHKKPFPVLVAFQRPFRRMFKSAVLLSAVLCFLYSHCWSRTLSAFNVSREEGGIICRGVFLPMLLFRSPVVQTTGTHSCHANHSCADERSIWILWAAAIIGHLWAYAMHEFVGKHHKDYRARSSSASQTKKHGVPKHATEMEISKSGSSLDMDLPFHGADTEEIDADIEEEEEEEESPGSDDKEGKVPWQSISATIQKFTKIKPEQPNGTKAMVSWYSNIIFTTGFDMLVSFKIFLGRFDARKMQVALLKESGNKSSDSPEGVFDFSTCKHYNHDKISDFSKEEGFWLDFVSDCGDGFNSSYQISRLLAQPTLDVITPSSSSSKQHGRRILPRGKLLINGGDLAYPDPTPDSYEKRFFRTFEDAMPPPPSFRREHISIRKPALPVQGWTIDTGTNARDPDNDARSQLSNYPGPCTFLVPGNHDWFDGLSTYTRYILSRDWLGGWLMPQRTSYFALKLPEGWWLLGFDLALDDDINIEQFHFFANLAASMEPNDAVIIVSHVPHWVLNEYENHSNDSAKESHLCELMRTHLGGRVKLRLAGDLHHYTRHVPLSNKGPVSRTSNGKSIGDKPVLIVSGGGGAFLHPTHCFQDQIKVGKERHDYSRVCAYPSTKVSRHLSWLNLWQFRWRNWRLDILWAITHFGLCSSLFPLCGVYDDYLRSNPTHHLGYLLLWVFRRVLLLFVQILATGRMSLLFTLIIMGIAYTFTDSSNFKWKTAHISWSMVHALAHISTSLICLLFVECMVEYVVSEGLVVTQNVGRDSNSQSCGTGLATSIYDEYTLHFSHTLEDFQLLNATNSTDPPDLLPSCRFDESLYEMVSSTFRWLYHEAPFLKTTLAVFDLPGVIGSTHVEMCDILCAGGAAESEPECTYANDFLKYQQLDRVTILKYLAAISLYFVIFAVPVAGTVFGTWIAITLNFLNCQYDEGFSSLRMEHWKNFLRMHIDENGDLEIFAIGLHRVPKKWRKDEMWQGDVISAGDVSTKPSWMWKNPSKWIPWRSRKKFEAQMIDYSKIKRNS
eukprot:CAMPEP_0172319744 /NCGR_PEP_ID=MMETSP1058-20130122/38599_1 /TAXON_ID=83371 /ORGANISM="Detonula confervacea, Strain CCMP 353" /LENGTH=1060 /DNA_ID=CAMNT_0013034863 /DNA_START=643 /DNA_END=3825 /DNA_ORIENTATION=+